MSLGKKTLALFVVLGLSICLGGYVALRTAVLPAFEEFEHRSAREALSRATQALNSDLHALEAMNLEYSEWNDTIEYVRGSYPEYEEEYLRPEFWQGINMTTILVFDSQGTPVFAWVGHPSDGRRMPWTDELLAELHPGHPLIVHESGSSSLTGLLNTPAGLMQIASYPVVSSDGTGPAFGTLIAGNFITDERVSNLGQRATVGLALHRIGNDEVEPHVGAALQAIEGSGDRTLVTTNAESVHGYQLLPDIAGAPAVVIETWQPRTISEIGRTVIRTTMIFLAAGSIGFLLAALILLQQLIVSPIKTLTQSILDIRQSGDLEIDVSSHRSDEVGVLANEFSALTASLKKTSDELEAARDEALSMSKAKSEFLARMSHEIRTPMNGVLGMTELLRNTALDDKQEQFAKAVYESAESLLHIINDILDISKIESGRFELDIAPFNLRHMVEECLDLLAEAAHRKDLELVGSIPPDTHVFVEGDALRLRQVLINLVSNAVKFTEHGEISVRVSEQQNNPESVQYRFEVEDSGVGVSPENLEKIFEPFSQEDGSTTRRYGGTGLGLSICNQLLTLMGGEISAECQLGKGCLFWFTVELQKDVTAPRLLQTETLAHKRVLIVDDNATNREALQQQLESWQMQVEAASSGPEALGLLYAGARADTPFELILLDMNMPDMDGLQLTNTIRETDAAKGAPLIMLSSVSGADVDGGRSAVEIDAWLTKPVRQSRLYDALVSHLGRVAMNTDRADEDGDIATASNDTANDNLHILLAEDNQVNQAIAVGMLNELGHETTVVDNGIDAVAAFKEGDFDLVIMDCQMPELDGFEATHEVREWEGKKGLPPTPIVALTANALSGDRERCLDAGMTDYVTKPFTQASLAAVIADNMEAATDTAPSSTSIPRVLIVDDNLINQQVTKAIVDDLGYRTEVASDGDKALLEMQLFDFDLILLDCHMPALDGYSTSREIRRLEEQSSTGQRIPIVALTADLMQSNRQRCLESGMDDYMSKPFNREQMRAVLSRWLPGTGTENSVPEVAIDEDGFSELTETTTLASIDRLALDEIVRLDPSPGKSMVREIVVSYCAVSTRLMLQLRSAVADNDADEIEVLAHSLKGSSGQIGATLLAVLCEQIIKGAINKDLSDARLLCEQAAAEHSAVIVALDKELQNIAA